MARPSVVEFCFVVFLVLLLCLMKSTDGKLKEGDCEVCVKFLKKFDSTISDADRGDQDKITKLLKKTCKKAKTKDKKFCFFVGAAEESAANILKEITKPIGYHKPAEAICETLKKKDSQICELTYDKPLDWNNINLKKMRVKELKKILSDWGETCDGCLEKGDFIKRIEQLKSVHVEL